jgi:hypothetical protein
MPQRRRSSWSWEASFPRRIARALRAAGVSAVFGPGARIREAAARILDLLHPPGHGGDRPAAVSVDRPRVLLSQYRAGDHVGVGAAR